MKKVIMVMLELENPLYLKLIKKKDLNELKKEKNKMKNRKTLFEVINLSLNYLEVMIGDKFEDNFIKNMILNALFPQ